MADSADGGSRFSVDLVREGYFRVQREDGTYLQREDGRPYRSTSIEKAALAGVTDKIKTGADQAYYVVGPDRWRVDVMGFGITPIDAPDNVPDAFVFASQTDVDQDSVVESEAVTPQGYNRQTAISVDGGEYSIDGGAFTSAPGLLVPGQSVRVRHTSADEPGGETTTTLHVGGVQVQFMSVTPGVAVSFAMPDITVTNGGGDQSLDLRQYYESVIPSGHVVVDVALAAGSAPLPTGWTLDAENERLEFDDDAGGVGSATGVVLEVTTEAGAGGSVDAESSWAVRSSGVILAENFSAYDTRAEWMDKLQDDETIGGGVSYPYTGWSGGQNRYADPVPGGSKEKLGFNFANFLSGGKSSYHRLHNSEGATEAGPGFELKFSSPLAEFYLQFAFYMDPAIVGHNFAGGGGVKYAFLNHLSYETGQIVADLRGNTGQRIPEVFRHNGTTASQFYNRTFAPPLPDNFLNGNYAWYPLLDTNPSAGASYADLTEWRQRHGFTYRDFNSGGDGINAPGTEDIFRFDGGKWYHIQFYVNYAYSGPDSHGIVKMWAGERGKQPRLLIGGMLDAQLQSSLKSNSVRFIFRPENATVPAPAGADGHGFYFDEIIVDDAPVEHYGGFSIPFPGVAVPTGYPYTGQDER